MQPSTQRRALVAIAVAAVTAGLILGLSSAAPRLGGEVPSARIGAVSPADYGAAAGYLGIGVPELRAGLERGETLAEIAAATPGRSAAALTAVLARAKAARLRAALASGRLSAAAASGQLATVAARARAEVARRPIVGLGAALAAAGLYLHVSRRTLLAEMRAGRSLAQIAERRGALTSGLVAALVSDRSARIAGRVAAGELSAGQASAMRQGLRQRIAALVQRSASRAP